MRDANFMLKFKFFNLRRRCDRDVYRAYILGDFAFFQKMYVFTFINLLFLILLVFLLLPFCQMTIILLILFLLLLF